LASVTVLIADDHGVVREGVKAVLAEVDGFSVVGEARSGSEVLPLVHRLQPDVVLLDIRLPDMTGYDCLRLIERRHPNVKTVVLSAYADEVHVQRAFDAGARGYILKSINPADLPSAIRQTLAGTLYRYVDNRSDAAHGLTERELTIIRAVARGLTNRAIARELWVTEQTVKFHLTNIYRKLGARNRTEAARAAFRLGVVESPAIGD
jgi:DNA-binding NarL/FixJ family response regulator